MAETLVADFNQDASNILKAAAEAVKIIRGRRAALDARGKAAHPLFVLAGESHNVPAQIIFHMLVIANLQKLESLAVGLENQHDILTRLYIDITKNPVTPSIKKSLRKLDNTGAHSLKSCIATRATTLADHSDKTMLNFLLKRNVPARFADVSIKPFTGCCDAEDSSTAASMHARLGKIVTGIGMNTLNGITVRNDHITGQLMSLAQDTGARIVYMRCGTAHVSGIVGHEAPKDALAAMLKNKNAAVLAMHLLSRIVTEADIPADSGLAPDEQHIVRSLPVLRASYDGDTGEPVNKGFSSADFKNRAMEAAYLKHVLTQLGFESDVFTADDLEHKRKSYEEGDGKAIVAVKPSLLERLMQFIIKDLQRRLNA